MVVLNLVMRWLHIFSVITAVGATVFMRFVLIPSLAGLDEEARSLLQKNLKPRIQILTHSAIGGILLSGLYNTHLLWKTSVFPYGYIYAVKVLVAFIIFLIAIFLTSSNPKRAAFQANRKKWLGVNLALAALVVILSACLRSLHQP
jgi:uncharacterized membrane protein